MSLQTWRQSFVAGGVAGPTLTAAAAASCIPTPSRVPINPVDFWYIGKILKLTMAGAISCAVTTPGTARFDVRLGTAGTVVVFDTGAFNLNIVAKTNVPWWLEVLLTVRAVGNGTNANMMGVGRFTSEAVVGAPLTTAGGNGTLVLPVTAPAVGAGFDSTAINIPDVFFTQTVATGSLTVHQYLLESVN